MLPCPVFLGPLSAVVGGGKNPPKPSNTTQGNLNGSSAAKWQQANGAKTDRQKRSETDSPKSAKTSEKQNGRKSAKTIGVLFVDLFLSFSSGPTAVAL